jgi:hypothetical protein
MYSQVPVVELIGAKMLIESSSNQKVPKFGMKEICLAYVKGQT